MPALLEVRSLNIDFVTAQGRVCAVRDVGFYIDAGEVLGLVGESGSGKSVTALSLLRLVSQVANRISVMDAGGVVETASAARVFAHPAHPYTRGLLNSVPTLRTDRAKPLRTIEGTVPAAAALPAGCAFEPRCSSRVASCAVEVPPLIEVAPGHFARCPVVAREVR